MVFSLNDSITSTDTIRAIIPIQKTPIRSVKKKIVIKKDTIQIHKESLSIPVVAKKKEKEIILIEDSTTKTNFTKEFIPLKKDILYNQDWSLLVVFCSFLVFIFIKLLFNKHLLSITQSVFSFNLSSKLFKDRNLLLLRTNLFLNLIFFINIGVFITESLFIYNSKIFIYHPFFIFLMITGFILIMYSFKNIFLRITGYVFNNQEVFKDYSEYVFLMNKNIGLYLFPFIITIPYVSKNTSTTLIIIGLSIIVFFILLRILRGLQLIIQKNTSLFYLILYLCILEFLPIACILKVATISFINLTVN